MAQYVTFACKKLLIQIKKMYVFVCGIKRMYDWIEKIFEVSENRVTLRFSFDFFAPDWPVFASCRIGFFFIYL